MTSRGSLPFGWAILAAALAVPGFLFYRWWSQVNTSNNQQLSQRVRKRLPQGALFAGAPAGGKLVNPISTGTAPAPAAPQVARAQAPAAPLPGEASQGPGEAPAVPQGSPETSLPVPGEKPPPAPAPMKPNASPDRLGDGVPPGPPPEAVLETLRDPTLSPYDRLRLEQMSLEESLARQQVREERRTPARREPPIESRIELQGIVSTEAGVKAIVNGEIVAQGDRVGGVRVVRITPQSVVFAHKKRRFTKTITK